MKRRLRDDIFRKEKAQSKKMQKINSLIRRRNQFSAPAIFSLIDCPDENVKYFNGIIDAVSSMKIGNQMVHYNLSKTKTMTIDTLMYMLAVVINTEKKIKYTISNVTNLEVARFICSSGVGRYIKFNGVKPIEDDNYCNLTIGSQSNGSLAKEICDFTIKNLSLEKKQISFLYDMLLEMMTNSHHHAYKRTDEVKVQWFIFAEFVEGEAKVKYTFVDNGLGIPHTMRKQKFELNQRTYEEDDEMNKKVLNKYYYLENKDEELIFSGLKEEGLRTRTARTNRGKGLPEIYAHYTAGRTKNLKIMSGQCICGFNDKKREQLEAIKLTEEFKGTLFYWEIEKKEVEI